VDRNVLEYFKLMSLLKSGKLYLTINKTRKSWAYLRWDHGFVSRTVCLSLSLLLYLFRRFFSCTVLW